MKKYGDEIRLKGHILDWTLIKQLLLEDIRRNPSLCYRESAFEYISQGLLTREELVDSYHLFTPKPLIIF